MRSTFVGGCAFAQAPLAKITQLAQANLEHPPTRACLLACLLAGALAKKQVSGPQLLAMTDDFAATGSDLDLA